MLLDIALNALRIAPKRIQSGSARQEGLFDLAQAVLQHNKSRADRWILSGGLRPQVQIDTEHRNIYRFEFSKLA